MFTFLIYNLNSPSILKTNKVKYGKEALVIKLPIGVYIKNISSKNKNDQEFSIGVSLYPDNENKPEE